MRILHVGYGFRPWIVNGLIVYAEAVMQGQVSHGHEVAYFFCARQLPLIRRPLLHRWERDGVRMYELINTSLIVGRHRGTPGPEADLDDPAGEAAFRKVLDHFSPELIHVHDLAGLPSSVLAIARGQGVPTVMTIHDYHPLCPTVKLYDAEDQNCLRLAPGGMCARCCADAPEDNREELARTLWYARRSLRASLPWLDRTLRRPRGRHISSVAARLVDRGAGIRRSTAAPGSRALARSPRAPAQAYQRRRELNLRRLSDLDALIASSRRSGEIYRSLGVSAPLELIPVNPGHIERLRPKPARPAGRPVRFVALTAGHSTQKGADLLVDALARLSQQGLDEHYRVFVHGPVAPHVEPALAAHPSVEIRPPYRVEELDALLDDGDVGLLLSVWEEVYGFVALEFLAKGIPVIGNAVGAIPELVLPGKTGWLNGSVEAPELAELMAAAIANPEEVERLGQMALTMRDALIEPFESGLRKLMVLYERLAAA